MYGLDAMLMFAPFLVSPLVPSPPIRVNARTTRKQSTHFCLPLQCHATRLSTSKGNNSGPVLTNAGFNAHFRNHNSDRLFSAAASSHGWLFLRVCLSRSAMMCSERLFDALLGIAWYCRVISYAHVMRLIVVPHW
jgi:hypothetical protein